MENKKKNAYLIHPVNSGFGIEFNSKLIERALAYIKKECPGLNLWVPALMMPMRHRYLCPNIKCNRHAHDFIYGCPPESRDPPKILRCWNKGSCNRELEYDTSWKLTKPEILRINNSILSKADQVVILSPETTVFLNSEDIQNELRLLDANNRHVFRHFLNYPPEIQAMYDLEMDRHIALTDWKVV